MSSMCWERNLLPFNLGELLPKVQGLDYFTLNFLRIRFELILLRGILFKSVFVRRVSIQSCERMCLEEQSQDSLCMGRTFLNGEKCLALYWEIEIHIQETDEDKSNTVDFYHLSSSSTCCTEIAESSKYVFYVLERGIYCSWTLGSYRRESDNTKADAI